MKVVRPEWLVESAKAGVLLPWHDFIFKPDERPEDSQGRQIAQTSLHFGTQANSKRSERSMDIVPTSGPAQKLRDSSNQTTNSKETTSPTSPPKTPTKATDASPSRPFHSTNPATPEQARRVPGYAEAGPNKAAERAMADPAWRAAHTSVAPDFIEGFYRNSRLHHLSTWKAELRNLVAEAQERAENGNNADDTTFVHESSDGTVGKVVRQNMRGKSWVGDGSEDDVSMKGAQLVRKGKGKEKEKAVDEERIIMHCDFDSFFVSAGLVDRPHLRGKPVVVCHSQGAQGGQSSTSEIASASYEAREFGIKGGMRYVHCRHGNSQLTFRPVFNRRENCVLRSSPYRTNSRGRELSNSLYSQFLTCRADTSSFPCNSISFSWRMPTTCKLSLSMKLSSTLQVAFDVSTSSYPRVKIHLPRR